MLSSPLCKYRDIFGKSGKGIHKYRMPDFAIVDFLLTIILAILIGYKVNLTRKFLIFILLLILSIIIHKLFCVNTTLTKLFDSFYKIIAKEIKKLL
jgi:fatty-acid desaturase